MRHVVCKNHKKHVIPGLNDEQVDWRSTSDKWWFDICNCHVLLACFILENNCSHWYVMLTTCWVWVKVWEIVLIEACSSSQNWSCDKQETWTLNLLNIELMSSIISCNSTTSTLKGKGKIFKVGCRGAYGLWFGDIWSRTSLKDPFIFAFGKLLKC